MPDARESSAPEPVAVDGVLVRSGDWSKSLTDIAADGQQVHRLLTEERVDEARALVQSRPAEEQAALVAIDADPEQVLALTGMNERGLPAYRGEVVDRLPSDLLAQLTAPGTRHSRYNPEILRAMSPAVFDRAVRDVLDPIDNPDLRTKVSWEWMEAVAAMNDPGQAANLLRHVDPVALEDAIMDRLGDLDLGAVLPGSEVAAVSRYQAMTEGFVGDRPSEYVTDPLTSEILDALWEAAPELLGPAVVNATKRLYGTG